MTRQERDAWRRQERRWTNNELADRIRLASGLMEGKRTPSRPKHVRRKRCDSHSR